MTARGRVLRGSPAPDARGRRMRAWPTAGPAPSTTGVGDGAPMAGDRSLPVWLEAPGVGVRAGVVPVGLRPDGSLDVPPPGPDAPAAWYTGSPAPGENGSSVIVGPV